ncbi:bile acid:sodium symporter family protein [Leucobacter coleopterorum]|uniref:Bile acid:sodium symporter family protein n=1 Tax=Leucobacter coleopterorum TaxID=2714933 RepID=A0ABX6JXZ7_9MICO|nr:bile acid:sodium symporter family protein [Leucobacter coleopterorum]QIM18473.1 bile acid:sodium symporter family protein [Leucobacter coleopterorum]
MNIDEAAVNFTPGSLIALGAVLAFVMFGIALDTKVSDFRRALQNPKAIIVAIAAQFLLLPAITFGLTILLGLSASVSLGLILVACCPPGNVSQVLTYRAKGDVALSVSMTAVSNVIAIFVMPANLAFWGGLHPTAHEILKTVRLEPLQMLIEIALIIGAPFVLGLLIAHRWPRFAAKVQPWAKRLSLLALLGFVLAALLGNLQLFITYIGLVLVAVFLHEAISLALGWGIARGFGLPPKARRAMAFELGIRNAGLGLGLVFTFFGGLGGMAVVAGWWGIWDIIAGLILATFWARYSTRSEARRVAQSEVPA